LKNFDAIIIGAGVIGVSIAYHLASKGMKRIAVLEKNFLCGEGSTNKATGGFRAQFGSAINVKLSLLSREMILKFKDVHGVDPEFKQNGYLFIAQNDDEMNRLNQARELQKENGLNEVRQVDTEEILKLNTYINRHNFIGGSFCASDGFISPLKILEGYLNSCLKLGVEIFYDTNVIGFNFNNKNKIESVKTTKETFSSEIFINAAGVWAGEISKLANIYLSVKPVKRQVAVMDYNNLLPSDLSMTIFVDNGFHFRMRDEKLLLLLPDEREEEKNFNTDVEDDWLEKVFAIAKERVPLLSNHKIDKKKSWAGLYEMSPDEHLILGKSDEIENLYFANGSSGHGVMHSPAIGKLLSESINGDETTIDISELSHSRFRNKKEIESIKLF